MSPSRNGFQELPLNTSLATAYYSLEFLKLYSFTAKDAKDAKERQEKGNPILDMKALVEIEISMNST
jgi:hypothetical protein